MSTRKAILSWLITVLIGTPLIVISVVLLFDESVFNVKVASDFFMLVILGGSGAFICSTPSIVIMCVFNIYAKERARSRINYLYTVLGAQVACGVISIAWAYIGGSLVLAAIISGYLVVGLFVWFVRITSSLKNLEI